MSCFFVLDVPLGERQESHATAVLFCCFCSDSMQGLHKGVKASQPPPIRRTCRVRLISCQLEAFGGDCHIAAGVYCWPNAGCVLQQAAWWAGIAWHPANHSLQLLCLQVRAFQEPPAAQPPQEVQDKDLQLVRKDMEILKYQLISTFKEELAASTAALRAEQAASTAALRAELASKADLAASTAALMAELASRADLVALQEQLQQNNRLTICLLVGAAVVGREELLNVLKALFGLLKVA